MTNTIHILRIEKAFFTIYIVARGIFLVCLHLVIMFKKVGRPQTKFEGRKRINVYASTLIRWNAVRSELSKNHDEIVKIKILFVTSLMIIILLKLNFYAMLSVNFYVLL